MTIYAPDLVLDTTPAGLQLIERAEGFRPTWYLCPAKVWTIAFGTTERTLRGVNRQTVTGPVSRSNGREWLIRSLVRIYEPALERLVMDVPLTAPMFSALTSFTYNVGADSVRRSTLLKRLKQRRYREAADELLRWVYAGGRKLPGLVKRRQAERALFLEMHPQVVDVALEKLRPLPPHVVTPFPAPIPQSMLRRISNPFTHD